MKNPFSIHVVMVVLWAMQMLLVGCAAEQPAHRTVLCLPVYGQSLALGEEATRITDFDALVEQSDGRIFTQRLDHDFGYFDLNGTKELAKRLLGRDSRSFELSSYTMALDLVRQVGADTVVCIFPGGQGATPYMGIAPGTEPYERLLSDIAQARDEALGRGWDFVVPALCWMHGETDMERRTRIDYAHAMRQFAERLNADVARLTGQTTPVRIVSYQTNQLTMAPHFRPSDFDCPEVSVAQAQMELIRDDSLFWASSPVYPYTFAHEGIHLTAEGQQQVGHRAARAVLGIIRGVERQQGLVPLSVSACDSSVVVRLHVPCPPLRFDTVSVVKAPCYGFSVVTPDGRDIALNTAISGDSVIVRCSAWTEGCSVRYAVNGSPGTTGPLLGPRGNLCDSAPAIVPVGDAASTTAVGMLVNWCFMFSSLAMP